MKDYDANEVIIRFGQPARFLGIVVEGEAEAVLTVESGRRRRLGWLRQGDFLGEMSLLTGEPTSADVVAVEKCRILLIPQDVFLRSLAVNPDAMKLLARTLTERLRSRQQDDDAQERIERAWRNIPDPYGLQLSTAKPAEILVINCGTSSLKYSYFATGEVSNNIDGIVERIGFEDSYIVSSSKRGKTRQGLGAIGYREAFEAAVDALKARQLCIIDGPNKLTAVGHRVVHGGDKYGSAVLIDGEVKADIRRNSSLAPLHNPPSLAAIEASVKLMPEVPQVAVFDTGFHRKMPPLAHLYGLPYDYYENSRIRRYGFHGISHNCVGLRAPAYLKRDFRETRLISCHLGNGASACAIDHGRSVDTSMGLTPLEGLMVGTRSDDIDPSVALYLCREKNLSLDQLLLGLLLL